MLRLLPESVYLAWQTAWLQLGRILHRGRYPLLFMLALTVALALGEYLGWPFLRAPTERFMSKQLQREVRIDAPFELRLLGGIQLSVGGLWIAAPAGFDAPHFIDAYDIELKMRYRDLMQIKQSGLLHVKSLRVNRIDAQLLRNSDGSATWRFADKKDAETSLPVIETLTARHGSAIIVDALTKADLKATFTTDEGSASNSASIAAHGKFRGKPFQAELSTSGFLPIASSDQDSVPIPAKGWIEYAKVRVDFDGTVSDLFQNQQIKGSFSVKGPSLSMLGNLFNITLPTTDPFKLNGLIEKRNTRWLTAIAQAAVGRSQLSGHFEFDPRRQMPLLEGVLVGKRLYLADLAPAFGTRNEDGSKYTPPRGRVIPDRPLDLPSLHKMDARVAINIDYVELGNAFAKPIAPLKGDLLIERGKLSLRNLDAHTADGSLSGLISVDAGKLAHAKAQPVWHINLNWKNITLEKWLRVSQERKLQAAKAGKKESPPAYVTGKLNGKSRLTGSGNSTAELLGSLDGDVSLFVNQGTISHLIIEALGLDLAQALGILLTKDKPLPMQCAVMDLKTERGLITPRVAMIDTPVTLVLIDGSITMAKESLNLRLTAKPKNISPFTVRSPIRVTGTFINPDVRLEKTAIAARVLGSIALVFVNPLAALLPFIDPGSGDQSPCRKSLAEINAMPQLKSGKQP